MITKSPLKSITINGGLIGAVIFALRIGMGIHLDTDEVSGVIGLLSNSWVDIGGLIASVVAIWKRWTAVDFDKSVFKQSTTWAGIFKGLVVILVALGFDANPEAAATTATAIFDIVTQLTVAASTIMVIYGRIRAKAPIEIAKAEAV